MKKQNLNSESHTSHFPPHTSSNGITLIALVITIIVMLILVAVSVSAAINGGLFGYAKEAKDKTLAAVDQEQQLVNNIIDEWKNGTIGGTTGETTFPEGIKVGDYVNYTPDTGTYKVADGEYGSGRDATTEGYQSFTTETGDSSLKWRILSINETTGEIEIVSATAGQTLTLNGADGYNHSVDILNDLCETLYSKTVNGEKVATARSIKVEDINEKTTYDPTTDTSYSSVYDKEYKYSSYSTSYRKYPNLYAKEDGFYVAGAKQPDGISGSVGLDDGEINADGVTEYKTVTGYTDDNVAETKKDVSVTYSYYNYAPESYLNTNLGINIAPTGLLDVDTNYWLASRCVLPDSSFAGFFVRYVRIDGLMDSTYLFDSEAFYMPSGYEFAVRPVVSLGSEIKLTKDATNSDSTVTYWNVEFK